MGELKPGWKRFRFGEMVTSAGATRKARGWTVEESGVDRYVGLEHLDSGSLTIRRWSSPKDVGANSDLRHFEPGDVILARRGIELRKVGVARFRGVASGHALVFRAKPGVVLPDFLPFFMQSDAFMGRADQFSVGSLSRTVNLSALMRQEFALPSLEEQYQISSILSNTSQLINNYHIAISSAIDVKTKFIEEIFPLMNIRNHINSVALNDSSKKLTKLCDVVSLQVGYPFKSNEYTSTGDRLLRCSNVGVNKIIWDSGVTCFWPNERRKEVSDYILNSGDIVIALDRPFITEGFKIAQISEKDLPALLLQRVGRFRVSDRIQKGFLWIFLNSNSFRWQLQRMQQGTDLPHISKFDIENTIISQTDMENQTSIVNKFYVIESGIKYLEKQILESEKLMRNMTSLFFIDPTI